MNARICARHSTDRDLESVFNVNARICACQTTDRDLETKKSECFDTCQCLFLFTTVTTVTPVTPVIFLPPYRFRFKKKNRNVCNLIQAYCFRFYLRLVTVIISGTMVTANVTDTKTTRPRASPNCFHVDVPRARCLSCPLEKPSSPAFTESQGVLFQQELRNPTQEVVVPNGVLFHDSGQPSTEQEEEDQHRRSDVDTTHFQMKVIRKKHQPPRRVTSYQTLGQSSIRGCSRPRTPRKYPQHWQRLLTLLEVGTPTCASRPCGSEPACAPT